MESNGLSKDTINNARKYLTYLSRNINIDDPDQVKTFISKRNVSDGHKKIIAYSYRHYALYYHLIYEMPKYHPKSRQIKIPAKQQVETLISSARSPLCIKLRISAETGLRPIQVHSLRAKDHDPQKRLLYPEPAKNGNPIISKISQQLNDQITQYINEKHLQPNDKLFKKNASEYGKSYRQYRNRLAEKLKDPQLRTIRLYDLRHYYATTEYARTRDILHVKTQMGHKHIETTLIYTQLIDLTDPEYIVKTASTIEEASKLLELGFEYIQDINGIKLYRKRK